MGKLIGVSAHSVYHWETGKTKHRASQLQAIAAVRKLGKWAVTARLEAGSAELIEASTHIANQTCSCCLSPVCCRIAIGPLQEPPSHGRGRRFKPCITHQILQGLDVCRVPFVLGVGKQVL